MHIGGLHVRVVTSPLLLLTNALHSTVTVINHLLDRQLVSFTLKLHYSVRQTCICHHEHAFYKIHWTTDLRSYQAMGVCHRHDVLASCSL